MGFGRRPRMPLWVVIIVICCIQQKASSEEDVPERVTIIPPLKKVSVISSLHSAHNGQVCSTWGAYHFKTFDGDIFTFPGGCNYIFATHCSQPFEDFNIQFRRQAVGNTSTISYVTVVLDGTNFKMEKDQILVNDKRIQLPYNGPGFEIENFLNYTKVNSKIGLTLLWNKKDSLMLELDKKYANQTCGLCGDFNGIPKYKEFYFENIPITDFQFGNQWKMNDPTEDCEDPIPPPQNNCTDEHDICRKILTGSTFYECNDIVGVNSYIEACVDDLCLCDKVEKSSCLCDTFTEYSRQCAHSGGRPQNWRSPELCPISCSLGMQYHECGSPCANTCTNSERSHVCEDHCVDGCFCPPGTVLDDINGNACIPFEQCSCIYNGESYAPGMTYSAPCRSCICSGGEWNCTELPCRGICSVEGGSHISTYDEVWYNFHGKCNYILTKICEEETFTVLGEVGPCGFTEFETCLKMVALTINGGETYAAIFREGKVIVNGMITQLPISVANVTIFQPSHSFIVMETNFGLQIVVQVLPLLQVFIYLDSSFKGRMCGLCGNFNHNQRDDFRTLNGLIEGTASAFANTWKTQASCDNIKQHFNDPCTVSTENEKYARHWCGLLTDAEGPFAKCHPIVNPKAYHTNCMFDTCACKISEKCMCAALSSYVRACRTKGIEFEGWRVNACSKYTTCPTSLNYSYEISSCQPTCRSLSEPDITCNIKFVPVDGCTCGAGTYMDESEICVSANKCPCYYKGTALPPGEVYHESGVKCNCNQGKLNCYGDGESKEECTAPMVYFDCRNATTDSKGAECQKSCQTLDRHCYNSKCVSGCICPDGLVSDDKGGCIPVEECPCIHNEVTYQPGEKIKVDCNTCICKNRMWKCTMETCLSTCAVYGDGHYITFDDKRYIFNGQCEYTLLQDYCGQNSSTEGSFRIISENIPCGTTGTTCSKSIKVFFQNFELILTEEQYKVVKRGSGGHIPYRIYHMGIYLVIEIQKGLIVIWDKKTAVFIKLGAEFKGEVCGLCGNYDGNGVNDFTTRSRSVVGDVLEFGNSWKVSPTCPDAKCVKDPCSKNPYRKAWSQKKCSIINSEVFAACHSQVEPTKYYDACVTDACACDTGGDCECFCTAVAAYAKVCSDHGVCLSWRTPSICPMFCDYYNNEDACEWHYKPCGAPCMKTCRNPSGRCAYHLPGLEGCYPQCPGDKPYFSEEEMKCVSVCGCYDVKGNYHQLGETFTTEELCQSCKCTNEGIISCKYDTKACYCYYEGKRYNYNEVIYNTTDGLGSCITAICGVNGTIDRDVYRCAGTTTTPPFVFTTSSKTESIPTQTTMCVHKVCRWMGWYDVDHPSYETSGDYETPENIRAKGHNLCKNPDKVECRPKELSNETLHSLNQNVICTPTDGLICNNKDQTPPLCHNYETRFFCCNFEPCGPLTPTTATKTTGVTKSSTPYIPKSTTPHFIETTRPTSQPSTLTSVQTGSTSCRPKCQWTQWFDTDNPKTNPDGDFERIEDIRARGLACDHLQDIRCQAKDYAHTKNPAPEQNIHCDVKVGLVCNHTEQTKKPFKCVNYELSFLCCNYSDCQPLTTSATSKPTSAKTVHTSTTFHSSALTHTISTSQSTPMVSTRAEVTTGKHKTTTLLTPPSTKPVTSGIISTASTTTPSTPVVSTSAEVTTGKHTTTSLPTPTTTQPVTTGKISTTPATTPSTPVMSTSAEVTTGKQTTTSLPTPTTTQPVTTGKISTTPSTTPSTPLETTSAEVTTGKQTTTSLPTPTTTQPVTTGKISTTPATTPSTPVVSTSAEVTTGKHTTTTLPTPQTTQTVTTGFISTTLTTTPSTPLVSTSAEVTTGKQTTTSLPTPTTTQPVTTGKISTTPATTPTTPLETTSAEVTTGKQTATTLPTPQTTQTVTTGFISTTLATTPSTPLESTSAEVTTGKHTTTTLPTPPSTKPVTSGIISTASTTTPSTPVVSTSAQVTTGKHTTTSLPTPTTTQPVTTGKISTTPATTPSTPVMSTSAEVTTGKQTTTSLPTPTTTQPVTTGKISTTPATTPSTPVVSTSAEVTTGKHTTTTLPTPPSTKPVTSGIISTASTTTPSTPVVSTSAEVTTGKQTTTSLPTPTTTQPVTTGKISTTPATTPTTPLETTSAEVTTGKQTTTTLPTPQTTQTVTTGFISTTLTTTPSTPLESTSAEVTTGKHTTTTLPTPPSTKPVTSGIISTTSTTTPSTPVVSTSAEVTTGKQTTTTLPTPPSTKPVTSGIISTASTTTPSTPVVSTSAEVTTGKQTTTSLPTPTTTQPVTTGKISTTPATTPSTPLETTSAEVTTGKQITTSLPTPTTTQPVTTGKISTTPATTPSTPVVSTSAEVTTGKQTTTTLPTPPSTKPVTSGIISTASTTTPSTPVVSTSAEVTTGKQTTTTLPTPPSTKPVTSGIISTASTTTPSTPVVSTSAEVTTGKQTTTSLPTPTTTQTVTTGKISTTPATAPRTPLKTTSAEVTTGKHTTTTLPTPPSTKPVTSGIISTASTTTPSTPVVSTSAEVTTGKQTTTSRPTPTTTQPVTTGKISTTPATTPSTPLQTTSAEVTTGKQTATTLPTPQTTQTVTTGFISTTLATTPSTPLESTSAEVTTGKHTTTTLPTPPSTKPVTSGIISTASTTTPSTPVVSTSAEVTTGKQTTTSLPTPTTTQPVTTGKISTTPATTPSTPLKTTSAEVTTGKQTTTTLPTPQTTQTVTTGFISTTLATTPSTPLESTSAEVTTGKHTTTSLPTPPSTKPVTSVIISTASTTTPSTPVVSTSAEVTTGKQTTTTLPTPPSTKPVTSGIISTASTTTPSTRVVSTSAEVTTGKHISTTFSIPLSTSIHITSTTAGTIPSTETKISTPYIPKSTTPHFIETTRPTSQPSTLGSVQTRSTSCRPKCQWTQWFDTDNPKTNPDGDFERIEDIRAHGLACDHLQDIRCQAKDYAHTKNPAPEQNIHCDVKVGLVCNHTEQTKKPFKCVNYELSFLCCNYSDCQPLTTSATSKPTSAKTVHTSTTFHSSALTHTISTSQSTPVVTTSAEVTTGKHTTTTLPTPPSTKPVTSGIISTASTTTPSTPVVSTSAEVTTGKQTTTTLPTPPSTKPVTSGIISTASTTTPSTPVVSTSAEVTTGKQTTTSLPTPTTTQPVTTGKISTTPATTPSTPLETTSSEVTTGKHTTTTLPTPPSTKPVTSGIISTASTTTPSTPVVSTSAEVTTGKQTTTSLPTPTTTQPVTTGKISTTPATTPSTPLQTTSAEVTTGKQSTTTLPTPQTTQTVTTGFISTTLATTPSTPLESTSAEVTTGKHKTTTLPTPLSTKPGIISTASTTTPSTPVVSTSAEVTTGKQTTTTLPTPPSTKPVTSGIISTASTTTPSTPVVSTSAEVTTGKHISTTFSIPLSTSIHITSTTAGTIPSTETKTSAPYIPKSTTPHFIETTRPTSQPSTLTSVQTGSTSCRPKCQWTQWFDTDNPKTNPDGDFERIEDIRARGLACDHLQDIRCQAKDYAHTKNPAPEQNIHCDVKVGLVCNHTEQTKKPFKCVNYELSFLCCNYSDCQPLTTSATSKPTSAKTVHTSTTFHSSALTHTISTSQSTPMVSTSAEVTTGKHKTTTLPTPPSTKPVTSGIISTASTTTPSTPVVSTSAEVTTGKQTTTTLPTPTTKPVTSGIISTASTTTPVVSTSAEVTTGNNTTTTLPIPSTKPVTSGIISTASTTTPVVSTSAEVTTGKHTTTTLPTPPSTKPVTSGIISTALTTTPSTPVVSTSAEVTTGKQTTTIVPTPLSTLVSTSVVVSTGFTLATTLSRATPCFCHVSGTPDSLFSPGETIYNRTDSSGCHFIAICDENCEIKRYPVYCPTITPRPTSGTLPTPSSTTKENIFSTPTPDCPEADPPRKYNETWMFTNCTKATCEGNNRIVVVPLPQAEKIICASGLEPKKIVDKDGCIERYECECICKGWDHYNFMTFDGTSYTFHGNCTYILVKEIMNTYGNLRILLDNDFCDIAANQSCSRSLIIYYNSMEVRLVSKIHEGVRVNKIFFGNESVPQGFVKNGIVATNTGFTMTIEIPEINSFVSFNGYVFLILLPHKLFQDNTEGQCGSCSNDRSDDCRKPNGQKASSCSEMAIYWQVPDIKKPYCQQPTTPPPTMSTTMTTTPVKTTPTPMPTPTSTPTPTPCSFPSPLCEVILSDVFAECHKVLSPGKFYDTCISETCQASNVTLSCFYIDLYASLCTATGACADWRNKTEGKCPYNCPEDKVYAPCAPIHPRTCENGLEHEENDHVAERCVCPEDSILFNSHSGLCVPECGCVGPDGSPKLPGSKWKSNCQECTCDPLTISIQCKPQNCSSIPEECKEEGYIPISILDPDDRCCPIIKCVCNTSLCSKEKMTCKPGYHVSRISYEKCCGGFECELRPDVCLVNESIYETGMIVPGKPCETCICSPAKDSATKKNVVECKPVTCNTDCPMGHEYQIKPGECCGNCVQVACIVIINGTAEILEPGHTITDNCKQYKCEPRNNTLVVVETQETCPFFDPTCSPDQIEWTHNGCCKICKEVPNCKPYKNQTIIHEDECVSEPIELTYCEGTCPSSSVYSQKEKAFHLNCNCCQVFKSHKKEVTLTCVNGTTIVYDYLYVDECTCKNGCIFEAATS
ncbi:mucin-5B-like isoform X2 [Erythrolamprus reginae]|uniref:mucin-5B-like isoform X2 n=1 Tax=Erythrolamprus reginae TaxID=121349 RepID=UPI00396C8D70